MVDNMLSDNQIKNAKPREKQYKLYDEKGLFIIIRPNKSKWWRFKYRFNNKYREISLGVYGDVSLKQARTKRDNARTLVADGTDPSARRQADKVAGNDTFEAVALEWLKMQTWFDTNGPRVKRSLEKDIFPWLGKRPIGEITPPELLATIKRVENRGAIETAHRILQTCGKIFRYAIATHRADRSPAQDIKDALKPVKQTHFASITDPKGIGDLLRAIDAYKGGFITRCALKLSPLVFTRPGELRHAEWSEIDLDEAIWRIPGEKMKKGNKHLIPLSRQAIEILEEIQPLTGDGKYVFPCVRSDDRPMSENTVIGALRRLGYTGDQMTAHGFRSMASTLLHEQGWLSDAIEAQLAHVTGGVKGVYNYAQHLPLRTEMMQAWADYLDGLKAGGKVVPIGKQVK